MPTEVIKKMLKSKAKINEVKSKKQKSYTPSGSTGGVGPAFAWGIMQLGYPVYVLTLLGTWKFIGTVAILIPESNE